jgi:hypothetical protein
MGGRHGVDVGPPKSGFLWINYFVMMEPRWLYYRPSFRAFRGFVVVLTYRLRRTRSLFGKFCYSTRVRAVVYTRSQSVGGTKARNSSNSFFVSASSSLVLCSFGDRPLIIGELSRRSRPSRFARGPLWRSDAPAALSTSIASHAARWLRTRCDIAVGGIQSR